MTEQLTNIGVGGILAILILRLVFDFLKHRRDSNGNGRGRIPTDKIKGVQTGVDSVLMRLDLIVDRLDTVADASKAARRQTEIACEQTERMTRAVAQLEQTIGVIARRTIDTSPGV